MDYQEHIRKAIEYIEENLTDALDNRTLARAAGYSEYHFLRVFREVGLAQTAATEGHFTVRVIPRAPGQPKADLNSSPFLQLLKQGNR